jgi:hypothetical protein
MSRGFRPWRVALLLPVVALAAGCSFGGSSGSSNTQPAASKELAICKVISIDDIKKAMGADMGDPAPDNRNDKDPACDISTADTSGAFHVDVDRQNSLDGAKGIASLGPTYTTASPKPVSGVADEASVAVGPSPSEPSKAQSIILARKDNVLITMWVLNSKPAPTADTVTALAKKFIDQTDLQKVHA